MGKIGLIIYDFIISLMWVWSNFLINLLVNQILGIDYQPKAEFLKNSLSVINMFFFAFLSKLTNGGSYNPLIVLASAVSGGFAHFLFTVAARIPAQVNVFLQQIICIFNG